jgi:SOS response regulatory protein OraA/RecX
MKKFISDETVRNHPDYARMIKQARALERNGFSQESVRGILRKEWGNRYLKFIKLCMADIDN